MQTSRKNLFCSNVMWNNPRHRWKYRLFYSFTGLNPHNGPIKKLSSCGPDRRATHKVQWRSKLIRRVFHYKWKLKNNKNAHHSKKKLSGSILQTILYKSRSRIYIICCSDEMRKRRFLCQDFYSSLHCRRKRLFENSLQKTIIFDSNRNHIKKYRLLFRPRSLYQINERSFLRFW
jgi:hypothetical protein